MEEAGGPPPGGLPGSEGDDGWETSTELPGLPGSEEEAGGGGEEEDADGGGGEEGEEPSAGGEPGRPGANGDDERTVAGDQDLDRALGDFDGEILDERNVIAARKAEADGTSGLPEPTGTDEPGGSPVGNGQSSIPAQQSSGPIGAPPPPVPVSVSVPPDTPDAKDDDVVARQLREAAMAEPDPELRERLWEEYRRYKSGL